MHIPPFVRPPIHPTHSHWYKGLNSTPLNEAPTQYSVALFSESEKTL